MAYTRSIVHRCTDAGCSRQATVEVVNDRNSVIRVCCDKHGRELAARITADEQASYKAERRHCT